MEITKLEHSCLIIRDGRDALVIDPGNYTRPVSVDGVVGIVITHEHPDHLAPEQVASIMDANPAAVMFGPRGVAAALAERLPGCEVDVVGDHATREVGPFRLSFFGSRHELIHRTVPLVDNTGVLVNERLFYPGDAYTIPDVKVDTLAAPVGAPWLRVSDMMDWVHALAPARSFPVHERTLSDAGFAQATMRLAQATEPRGTSSILQPGETLTI